MSTLASQCIACGTDGTQRLDDKDVPSGVTSDCKPWSRCGKFVICEKCGHVQKSQDDQWQQDVARIYREYEMYILTNGSEQVIFDEAVPLPRTRRLLDCFSRRTRLPRTGSMLDVGCGNGSTLRTFNSLYPEWHLSGFDVHNRFEPTVRSIPNVNSFYSGSLAEVDQKFDIISMVYVVEHLPEPLKVLNTFRRLLKPNGMLLVHTSNYWDNPFDLAVVDHCSHFVVETLAATISRAGFEVLDQNDDWIPKEIGVIARLSDETYDALLHNNPQQLRSGAEQRLRWMGKVVKQSEELSEGIGIFGTAIAGSWLASRVNKSVRFFVDEDRQRTGKKHLGYPVMHPADVPANAPVYMAFPPPVAKSIASRLRSRFSGIECVIPPEYEAA